MKNRKSIGGIAIQGSLPSLNFSLFRDDCNSDIGRAVVKIKYFIISSR